MNNIIVQLADLILAKPLTVGFYKFLAISRTARQFYSSITRKYLILFTLFLVSNCKIAFLFCISTLLDVLQVLPHSFCTFAKLLCDTSRLSILTIYVFQTRFYIHLPGEGGRGGMVKLKIRPTLMLIIKFFCFVPIYYIPKGSNIIGSAVLIF